MSNPRFEEPLNPQQRRRAAAIVGRVDQPEDGGCWLWPGAVNDRGYGYAWWFTANRPVHRVSYAYHTGPIPSGAVIDHLCRTPGCINPDHLEAVSHSENVRRGWEVVRPTHCPRGHPYDEHQYVDPNGWRHGCRACWPIDRAEYAARKKRGVAA